MRSVGISWWVEDAREINPKPKLFNETTAVIELFAYVLNEVEMVKIGESFLLRDLFKGYIWNRLSQSQKAELGRLVSDYIDYEYPIGLYPLMTQRLILHFSTEIILCFFCI